MIYTFISSGTDNGKQFHTRTMAIHDYNVTFE